MNARDNRKYELESLLHKVDGDKMLAGIYRASCPPTDVEMLRVRPIGSMSLRDMIATILEVEFPSDPVKA